MIFECKLRNHLEIHAKPWYYVQAHTTSISNTHTHTQCYSRELIVLKIKAHNNMHGIRVSIKKYSNGWSVACHCLYGSNTGLLRLSQALHGSNNTFRIFVICSIPMAIESVACLQQSFGKNRPKFNFNVFFIASRPPFPFCSLENTEYVTNMGQNLNDVSRENG